MGNRLSCSLLAALAAGDPFRFSGLRPGVFRVRLCLDSGACFATAPRPLVSSEDLGTVFPGRAPRDLLPPTTVAYALAGAGAGVEAGARREAPPTGARAATVLSGVVRDRETRKPLEGAYVWWRSEARCFVLTGAEGGFSLPFPESDGGSREVTAPGYLDLSLSREKLPSGTRTRAGVDLDPARGELTGAVLSAWRQPVAGAVLYFPTLARATRASQRGEFHIDRLPHPSTLGVTVAARGFEPGAMEADSSLPSRARPVIITLESRFSVSGEIRDGSDASVPGVEVQLVGNPGDPFSAVSDASGRFTVPLPRRGKFRLRVEVPDGPTAHYSVIVDDDYPRVDLGVLRLEGEAWVWGFVRASAGESLANVEVFEIEEGALREAGARRPLSEPVARTGEDGSFEVALEIRARRETLLEFWRDGYHPGRQAIRLGAPEVPVVVTLERSHGLRGRVVDASGAPVEGATVWVEGGQDPALLGGRSGFIRTDAAGRFEVGSLTAGDLRLAVLPATAGLAAKVLDLHEGSAERDLELEIVLPPAATLRGQVRDASGQPLPGILVGVAGAGARAPLQWACRSDARGRCDLFALPPGPVRLELGWSGGPEVWYEDLVLLPGEQELDLHWSGSADRASSALGRD